MAQVYKPYKHSDGLFYVRTGKTYNSSKSFVTKSECLVLCKIRRLASLLEEAQEISSNISNEVFNENEDEIMDAARIARIISYKATDLLDESPSEYDSVNAFC